MPVISRSKTAQGERLVLVLWVLAVLMAAVVPYIPSLRGGFVLDDEALIVEDPLVHSLSNLPKSFTTDFLHGNLGAEAAFYYRPLITSSFQIDYAVAGPNPLYFRSVNLLVNLAVVFMVFALTRHITGSLTASGIAAAAFAVLPSHVESVGWISGRTDLISTMFIMASVLVFAKAYDSDAGFNRRSVLICSLLFLCALLSKESGAVVPLVILIYAWAFRRTRPRRLLAKWGLALLPALLVYLVLRRLAMGADVEQNLFLMLGERLMGVGIAYAAYLRMLFLPQELRVMYDVFPIGIKYPLLALAAWMLPVGMAVVAVLVRRSRPVAGFALLWIVLTLLPVTNIIPTIGPLPAERFVYLASVGSSLLIGMGAAAFIRWRPWSLATWPVLAPALVLAFVLYCSALTVQSTRHYLTTVNWARAIAVDGSRFASMRMTAGANLIKAGLFDEGIQEMKTGIALADRSVVELSDYLVLAVGQRDSGDAEGSLETLETARENLGDSAEIRYHEGIGYAVTGRLGEAVEAFEAAVRMQPSLAPAWRNLGKAYAKMGRYRDAVTAYERAFQSMNPSPQDRLDLALSYKRAGQPEKADKEFRRLMSESGEVAERAALEMESRETPKR